MISITIPAYNGAEFLNSALASIAAQDFADREVLLVDDGSSQALRPPPFVRCFRQARRGPSAARNRGIQESRGEFLAFLDIDDMWAPGHLSRLHAALISHPEAGIAQGRMQQLCGDRISRPYRMPYVGSCMFRRETLAACGGFDETMTLGEDYDLMFRCWEMDVIKVDVDQVSLIYRRHSGNASRGKNMTAHVTVLRQRVRRIRAGLVDPAQKRRVQFREYIGDTEGASQWTAWSA